MRADGDALVDCQLHGAMNGARITGMEAAGDVGRGDMIQQRRVVAHFPGAEAFAHVAVQIQRFHRLKINLPTENTEGTKESRNKTLFGQKPGCLCYRPSYFHSSTRT